MNSLRTLFLSINTNEVTFARRGFRYGEIGLRDHLESIGSAFLTGYNAVIANSHSDSYVPVLNAIDANLRGFAYEGAGMGLCLLDRVIPWKTQHLNTFLNGPGAAHKYVIHVAIGWVAARLPGPLIKHMNNLDPVLKWLVIDGYGFHSGYFHGQKYLRNQVPPKHVRGYAARVFDQGLGRSMWFIEGGHIPRIYDTISLFRSERRADLWSGVGLAATYAGQASEAALKELVMCAVIYRPHVAQGAAFAAKARHHANNQTAYTNRACNLLCGLSSEEAAALTDKALLDLPTESIESPSFETWRQRIQSNFTTL